MKALKGVLVYIGIVLAIILVIAMALFGLMYFIPSFRILGVGVTHVSKKINDEHVSLASPTGDKYSGVQLSLSSNKVPIEICASSEVSDIMYSLDVSTFGISFDITEYRVIKEVEVIDGVLKISLSVTEPEGLISISGHGVKVVVPQSKTFALVFNTKSASVTIDNENNNLKISKLSVNTTAGNLYYERGENDNNSLSLSALNLSTKSGTMNLSTISNLSVSTPIKINAERGTFKFDKVKASFDVKGTGITLLGKSITCKADGFSFLAENGKLKVDSITSPTGAENSIITETAGIYITTLKGMTGINTSSGTIDIEETNDSTVIQSEHGSVTIKRAIDDINIVTHYGDIVVDSYLKNGQFSSRRGNITVNSTSDYVNGYSTVIENVNGNISVINKINKLRIITKGTSKVTVTFEKIKGGLYSDAQQHPDLATFQHSIEMEGGGSAVVYLPSGDTSVPPYKFLATGNVSGVIKAHGDSVTNTGATVTAKDTVQYYPNQEYFDTYYSGHNGDNSCEFKFSAKNGSIELIGRLPEDLIGSN